MSVILETDREREVRMNNLRGSDSGLALSTGERQTEKETDKESEKHTKRDMLPPPLIRFREKQPYYLAAGEKETDYPAAPKERGVKHRRHTNREERYRETNNSDARERGREMRETQRKRMLPPPLGS